MDRDGIGHNGGPALDEHVSPWESGDPFVFFAWTAAYRKVRRDVPWEIMVHRAKRAEQLGLTDDEYTREIVERGRHLSAADPDTVAAIKRRRPKPHALGERVEPTPRPKPQPLTPQPRGVSPASPAWGLMARATKMQHRR